jgi:DNA-nicking Smr family endonuclease
MSFLGQLFRRILRKPDHAPVQDAFRRDQGAGEPPSPSGTPDAPPAPPPPDEAPSPQVRSRQRLIQSQKKKHARRRARRSTQKAAQNREGKGGDRTPANRNRIPTIPENVDWEDLFGLRGPEETDPAVFEKMVEDNLSRADMRAVIAEKEAGLRSEQPRSLKARIKAYPPPQKVLDLHGCTAADAVSKVESFVQTSHGSGLKTVLIIVGKGRHSEDAAVLPRIVRSQLQRLKQRKLALHFEWEKWVHSKSGALIVYLV